MKLCMEGKKGAFVAVDFLDLFNSGEFIEAFFKRAGPLVQRQSAEFEAKVGPIRWGFHR